jgi:hypothetical protein
VRHYHRGRLSNQLRQSRALREIGRSTDPRYGLVRGLLRVIRDWVEPATKLDHVRYAPKADKSPHRGETSRWAISGLMNRSKKRLFDHLVGQLLQLQGQLKAERLGCREVDNQIEFSWLLYRKLRGLGSAQYLIH